MPTPHPTIQQIADVYDHYYTDNHFAAIQAVFELGAEYGRAKQREEVVGDDFQSQSSSQSGPKD